MFNSDYLEETLAKAFGEPEKYLIPMGITRYDYARMHGWWVRIHRDEVHFQELFFDSHYPSIFEGLKAAIKYRHEILSSFPPEKKTKIAKFKTLSKIPSERIHRRIEKGKKQPYINWTATWYDNDFNIKTKRFSVRKFGEEGARNLALNHTKEFHNNKTKPLKTMENIDPYSTQKFKEITREDVEILSSIDSGAYKNKPDEVIPVDPFAFEGERHLKLHLDVERDKTLRDAKIKAFLLENDAIFCEVCAFRFTDAYPFLVHDIIEVHHIVPLSKLTGKTKVKLDDLILLCANCHLAVHQGDAENNLLLAMEHFSDKQH